MAEPQVEAALDSHARWAVPGAMSAVARELVDRLVDASDLFAVDDRLHVGRKRCGGRALELAEFRRDLVAARHPQLRQGGGDLEVATLLDLAVKVLLVVVFRYRQEARDLWRDGRLVASVAQEGLIRLRE